MARKSFEKLKAELDDACAALRSFTLGKPGSTQKEGAAGMQRVSDACDRLSEGFASGPHATAVKTAVAVARGCIAAARARLAVLKGKP